MGRVRSSEAFAEIRIALPVSIEVPIVEPRVSAGRPVIAGHSAMRQVVSERALNCSRTVRIAHKVSLPVGGVAPRSPRIPVPGLNRQLRVQAIADASPSGAEHGLHVPRIKN